MEDRRYWLALFGLTSWQEFLDSGAGVYGLNRRYEKAAAKSKPGDYFICYVGGISRFIGILEITSAPFWDNSKLWTLDIYPVRIRVRITLQLTPETAVPVKDLASELPMFKTLKNPNNWAMLFGNSMKEIRHDDAQIIIKALTTNKEKPIVRPILKYKVPTDRER